MRVIQHAVAIEFVAGIELALVPCAVEEVVMAVGLIGQVLKGEGVDGLLGRVDGFDLADGRAFRLLGLI